MCTYIQLAIAVKDARLSGYGRQALIAAHVTEHAGLKEGRIRNDECITARYFMYLMTFM